MEQIRAIPWPGASLDGVEIPVLGHSRAEGAIGGQGGAHLGLAHGPPHYQEEAATTQPQETTVWLRGHVWMTDHNGSPLPGARSPLSLCRCHTMGSQPIIKQKKRPQTSSVPRRQSK